LGASFALSDLQRTGGVGVWLMYRREALAIISA
jgi:hypothetical protein